MAVRDV